MNITIHNNMCWMCGSEERITMHHVIPQTFKPLHNISIPLCRKCHDKLHEIDGTLTFRHLDKTLGYIDDVKKSLGIIKKNLNTQTIGSILNKK